MDYGVQISFTFYQLEFHSSEYFIKKSVQITILLNEN